MIPRDYQQSAIDAIDYHLRSIASNPCVVIPTGGGKSPVMAWVCKNYVEQYNCRIIVLAHVKELVAQNADKMRAIWPQAPIGVYSAGLGSRDMNYSITFAGIQSVYKKACEFPPFDLIVVDEAHRIPLADAGQYRQFIRDAKLCNPKVRVAGFTATAYRLDGGSICHPDFILNDICYEANVKDLILAGHLCKLRTKLGENSVDASGVKKSGGDFNKAALAAAAMPDAKVDGIASELASILFRENRQSAIVFCVTVEHAEAMSRALAGYGIDAPTIHEKTSTELRRYRGEAFKAGKIRALVNVNVLSEGFDAQRVDCVAMIRPTASKGLYYQQVGRGLRTHASKSDCLVLDFAGNIFRHGPIDVLEGETPHNHVCSGCNEVFPKIIGKCPQCGEIVPPPTPAELEAKERAEREIPDDPKARAEVAIVTDGKPWEVPVESVTVNVHRKEGKPPTLCVTYVNNLQSHREWICFEHAGYAGHLAAGWWKARFATPVPKTAEQAMNENLFLEQNLLEMTESITVKQDGRYTRVDGVKLRKGIKAFSV
jgi:DNA repair protein RadD